jgi:hypothetical protein
VRSQETASNSNKRDDDDDNDDTDDHPSPACSDQWKRSHKDLHTNLKTGALFAIPPASGFDSLVPSNLIKDRSLSIDP